jgi:VIT1/CCC1 family predicted Fe2+/Mn2+ transporter
MRVRGSVSSSPVHLSRRSNWLRAAVLGANDGILSTASLVLGVAASGASRVAIVTAGIAGLVAGALSMAAGEYVSVSSQRDAERADIRLEERELRRDPRGELRELAAVYERRGLPPALASEVAQTMSRRDALEAHARDELGLDAERLARPFQAAWTSALSFSAGPLLPLLTVAAAPTRARAAPTWSSRCSRSRCSASARLGGAPRGRATVRVVAWGAVAMASTAGIGALVGAVI